MFKGTVIAQIIAVLGSIYLAKIYGSEAYGLFGTYISISSIFLILNTLQLDNCIVTITDKNESRNLTNALFYIAMAVGLLTVFGYSIYAYFFNVSWFKLQLIAITLGGGILFSFTKIHEAFFTLHKKYHYISNGKILLAIFNFIFQFLFYWKFKLLGLVYGSIFSLLVTLGYYFIRNKKFITTINPVKLKYSILKNKSVVQYLLPSALINSLAINIIPVLMVAFFSLKDSGVYFFSYKILATPLFLIGSSVSQVYYQKSTILFHHSKEKLYKLTKQLVWVNLLIMAVFLLLINTVGIYILEIFFNKNWENLRLFTLILSFLILVRSSFNPISNIIIVLDKNHIALLFNVYLLIVNLTAIYTGYLFASIVYTVVLLTIFGSIGYLVLLFYFLNHLKTLR